MAEIYASGRTELLPFVPPLPRRVLDVGCSQGGWGVTLREHYPDVEIIGVEPVAVAAETARATGAYADVMTGLFPDVAPSGTFDAVFFNDVLEHMPDPLPALRAARKMLTAGGRVVASVPNARHITVWWPLIRRGEWTYTDEGIMDITHLRWFTDTSLRELFREAGLWVENVEGINRARWPEAAVDTWKTRWLSRVTGGKSDPFFYAQYVAVGSFGGRQ